MVKNKAPANGTQHKHNSSAMKVKERYEQKLSEVKKRKGKRAEDEEIDSDEADLDDGEEAAAPRGNKSGVFNDPFLQTADQEENVEEKRLRMTKKLLTELKAPDHEQ